MQAPDPAKLGQESGAPFLLFSIEPWDEAFAAVVCPRLGAPGMSYLAQSRLRHNFTRVSKFLCSGAVG
jgi:hypothetical protein